MNRFRWKFFITYLVLVTNGLYAQISSEVLLTEILKKGLMNPSLTFQSSADAIPPKHMPVYLRVKSRKCKACKYEINRAWINGKLLKYGKISWQFESLSGENPYLLKVDLDEMKGGKLVRNRILFGDLTERKFDNIISLDLVAP